MARDLETAIAEALRAAIGARGPIILETVGDAVHRVVGALRDVDVAELMRLAGLSRWRTLSQEERTELARRGGRKAWEGVPAEARSAEMRRRADVRKAKATDADEEPQGPA